MACILQRRDAATGAAALRIFQQILTRTYADKGWKSWGDWLGTGTIATHLRQYRPFREARAFARNSNSRIILNGARSAKARCRNWGNCQRIFQHLLTELTPTKAGRAMGDWLGTGNIATRISENTVLSVRRGHLPANSNSRTATEWLAFAKAKCRDLGDCLQIFRQPEPDLRRQRLEGHGRLAGNRQSQTSQEIPSVP